MPDSTTEQVLQALETVLATITTANGYTTDVAAISRNEVVHDVLSLHPHIVITDQRTREEQESGGVSVQLTVTLDLVLKSYENQTQLTANFIGDVKKCLAANKQLGLASGVRYALVTATERFHGYPEDPESGAYVDLDILFKHQFADPFTFT